MIILKHSAPRLGIDIALSNWLEGSIDPETPGAFSGQPVFKMKKIIYMAAAVVCLASFKAGAGDYYVSQSGSGATNGADAADAYPLSWLNGSSSWSGTIHAGDTVHLVGTLANAITVSGSGSSGKPITILFETNAKMVAAAAGSFITVGGNYIVIDGGFNGIIQNTNNGTALGNKVGSTAISAGDVSYLTVKNLTIANLYVRVAGGEDGGGTGIRSYWNGGATPHDITVSNCVLHDMQTGFNIDYGPGASNFVMASCIVSNCNWGGNAGDHGSSASLTGLSIINNRFSNWAAWEDPADNNHHNGFYGWAESGGSLRNVTASGNLVGPGYTGSHQTSGLFFSGNIGSVLVYNNIFIAATNESWGDGMLSIWQHDGNGTNIQALNNTFAGGGNGIALWFFAGSTTYVAENNIMENVATAISQFNNSSAPLVADYNLGYNLKPSEAYNQSATGSSLFENFAQWQTAGNDAHGGSLNPNLDSNYVPQPGGFAIGTGKNLSVIFTTDYAGNTRTNAGNWDIGAYAFNPAVGSITTNTPSVVATAANRPAAPSGLHLVW